MFEWDDSYLLGDIFIDSEHQILFKLAAKVSGESGVLNHDELMKYLQALFEYTRYHFEHEERLMEEIGWEGLGQHREIHSAVISEMRELIVVNKKSVTTIQVKLSQLLNRWIVDHVIKEDQKFKSALFRKRGFFTLD